MKPIIRLWKSKDLKNWEDMGLVWQPGRRDASTEWVNRPVSIMDRLDNPRQNSAITAPEIHNLKGTFWLAFSRNHYGTGLLKSSTGTPEGPYVAPVRTSITRAHRHRSRLDSRRLRAAGVGEVTAAPAA
jgi:beta-xylosidase